MLPSMPGTAATPEPPKASSFASLLAGFAALTDKAKTSGQEASLKRKSTGWNDDALEDDVTVISYEQALRAHTRTRPRPAEPPERPLGLPQDLPQNLPQDFSPGLSLDLPPELPPNPVWLSPYDEFGPQRRKPPASVRSAFENAASMSPATMSPGSAETRGWDPETTSPDVATSANSGLAAPPDTLAENRKSASITIRLSKPECAQLHQRATAAGLTVSAYLRSCVFEAESLRAQVVETLAQLRSVPPAAALKSATPAPKSVPSAAPSRSWLFPRWNWARRTLNA
jgi:hypothetical protein